MGRLKQYSEQEVLDKAMYSFWENGYKNTTIRQLEKDMGINQFSIYSSFKNKDELFRRVLINYEEKIGELFLGNLKKKKATIIDVREFLLSFGMSIYNKKIPNSCLMVRSVANLDLYDVKLQVMIKKFFRNMHRLFKRALVNSVNQNLISKESNIENEAKYLVGVAQSVSVYSKLNSKSEIRKYIDMVINKVT